MTCVIKKSLFTHQKPRRSEAESAWQNVFTHQEINNLSYVLLSHLHRSLIALLRRHTPAWLYEKRADQGNIQKSKRDASAGAADETYLIHREGWIHQHFLELNFSILLICKEGIKFCPRQKKDTFSILLLDNRDIKITWNQSLNFCAMKTKDGTVPCL